jgi:hypothetical protein
VIRYIGLCSFLLLAAFWFYLGITGAPHAIGIPGWVAYVIGLIVLALALLLGWAITTTQRREASSVRLESDGLTFRVRNGSQMTVAWADREFGVYVQEWRRPDRTLLSLRCTLLNARGRQGPVRTEMSYRARATISPQGLQYLLDSARVAGMTCHTTERRRGSRFLTLHLIWPPTSQSP